MYIEGEKKNQFKYFNKLIKTDINKKFNLKTINNLNNQNVII